MNFEESDEQKLVRDTTASFVKRHCKLTDVRQWDRTGQLPEHVYAAMAEA
ncbi:acyl-CoA dehydrogenase family protein, partial [Acinetobacter baumannii]